MLSGRTIVDDYSNVGSSSRLERPPSPSTQADADDSDAEQRRELDLRHRSRPRRTRVTYLVQRMRPKFEVIYPIGPVPNQEEAPSPPAPLLDVPPLPTEAPEDVPLTSPPVPSAAMENWLKNLSAAEPLDALSDDSDEYDDLECKSSLSHDSDSSDCECSACGAEPEYVSEALPPRVAILPALTPEEHAALLHAVATGAPIGELTRPAMLTDTGAVVEVPQASSPRRGLFSHRSQPG